MKSTYFCTSFPPTINTYYGTRGKLRFINARGKEYRKEIEHLWSKGDQVQMDGRLILCVSLFPPDKRKRDIDNVVKPLQDALMHAGVFEDDSQIDMVLVRRMKQVKGGMAHVFIFEADDIVRTNFNDLFNDMAIEYSWNNPNKQVLTHEVNENAS